jgi:hypothetical protein
MRGAHLCIAIAIPTASLVSVLPVRAQSGATLVAIVTTEPNASLTRRVRAELQGLGLDVIVLKPPEEGSAMRAPLELAARSVGAIGAVRLVPSGEGKVEVWVADRVTGKALVRELAVPPSGASDAALAVGSVELLRASLMELHSGEPPHGDVPVNEKVRALALPAQSQPKVARLGIAVGAGAELGVRGLGLSADADIGLWLRIASRTAARLIGYTSLSPAHVVTGAGAVDVTSQLVGAMASYTFTDASSEWAPSASIGIALAHVTTTGTAVPPFISASEAAWAAAPLADLGLGWSFAPELRIRADGLGLFAVPPIRIRTPAREVGWWGGPGVILSLGVEVLWAP